MLIMFVALSVAAFGQTNPPTPTPPAPTLAPPTPTSIGDVATNILTAIPQATSFTNTSFELKIGTRANQLNVENIVGFQYNFSQSFFLGGEIQNGPASTVIDLAGINFGVRKAWDQAEIYGLAGGRRNWTVLTGKGKPSWEAVAGFGAAYRPMQSGMLSSLAVFSEGLGVWSQNSQRGALELRAGLLWAF